MTTVCTCSHSIEQHGVCGGRCEVCTCHCFRGAKRIPRSCRYPLRNKWNSPRDYDAPASAFAIPCGGGLSIPLSAEALGLTEENAR